jgi:hypothetical protein
MVTIRIRSLMWFATGILVAAVLAWSFVAWRAYASPGLGESTVVSITPVRVLDTRDPVNVGLAGPFVSAVSQDLKVTGSIPTTAGTQVVVPAGATGVLLNVTVAGPTAAGFISIRPADAPGIPTTSSLNFTAGETLANAVSISVPTAGPDSGKIEITYDALGVAGPRTDILIDVVGYTTNAGIQDLVASIAAKAAPTKVTRIRYFNETSTNVPSTDLVKVRDLGTFSKASASTMIKASWTSHVLVDTPVDYCAYQIRVDGADSQGSTLVDDLDGTEAVVSNQTNAVPASTVSVFSGLAAGNHTVSLWVYATGPATCTENDGNFRRSVIVEEFTSTSDPLALNEAEVDGATNGL